MHLVSSLAELQESLASGKKEIEINGTISGIGMLVLQDGQCLSGGKLEFKSKGIGLSSNNSLHDIEIVCADTEQAIWNNSKIQDFGTLNLSKLAVYGQVNIIAENGFKTGLLIAQDIHVISADVRGREKRPFKYGVETLQGGFTIWNQSSEESELTIKLTDITIGTESIHVQGSGIFISGYSGNEGEGGG